ncbi:MAG: GxxExxY protein [candidate division WOR-3 bacterium]|nr:GxxExxY protein [candidate division WOR-3 bacterium]
MDADERRLTQSRMKVETYKYSDITEKIIKASYEVHNNLGYGFLEKVYENSLAIELRKMGVNVEQQKPIKVLYKDEVVGDYVADLVVEGNVIVEIKSVSQLEQPHEVQLVNYLKATGMEIGLLINFGKSVEVKRKIFENINNQ